MHSLRGMFSAAGVETPPFLLRDLAQRLDVGPPITMLRIAAKLPPLPPLFPENEVELFKSYVLNFDLMDIANDIPSKEFPLLDIPENKEARRLQDDRRALREMLEALGEPAIKVADVTGIIRDKILGRDAGSAEDDVDNNLPELVIDLIGPTNPIWENALRKDDVKGSITVLQNVILPGYKGRDVPENDRRRIIDVALFLRPGTAERRFRTNLLTAESRVGQRRFEDAIKQYDEMLGGGGLSEAERKFVALRKAAAQNAFADQEFNGLPPGDAKERQRVREKYLTTASILKEAGVSIENPRAQELLAHAENQLFLVDNGFNALGSPSVTRPQIGKSAAVLRNEAQERLNQASSAIQAFKEFTQNLESISDEDVKIQSEISIASSAIDGLESERGILEEQRRKLREQRQFLNLMQAFQVIATTAAIIVAVVAPPAGAVAVAGVLIATEAGKKNAAKVVGGVSSAAEGTAKLIELEHQKALVDSDEAILDLQFEGLAVRERAAQRHKTFLDGLKSSTTFKLQKYLELSNRFEDFSLEAIRGAMRKAYQAEVQLAFERGTTRLLGDSVSEPQRPMIDPSILNYKTDAQLFALRRTFEKQLTDLSEEIDKPIQRTDIRELTVFLSELDVLALARLRQHGETDFAISLYDVDQRLPGNPNVRIIDVSIELPPEILPNDGLTVTLTHRGAFLVRDAETLMDAKQVTPSAEAVQQAGLAFSEGRTLTVEGVTFINAGENRRPFRLLAVPPRSQPSASRQGLEGYGLTGLWNLKINENELDEVNLNNLVEATLKFRVGVEEAATQFEGHINQLIRDYETKQEAEQSDVLDKITFFGMRDKFKDELNTLIDKNPEAGVDLDIEKIMNGDDGQKLLKALVLQVIDEKGKGIPDMNLTVSKKGRSFGDFKLKTQAGGFTEDLSAEIPIIPPEKRFPVGGTWTLKVPNTQALKSIDDMNWFIVHEARKPNNS